MSSIPVGVWSLKVPATDEVVAIKDIGVHFDISVTMAAIDPTERLYPSGPKISTLRILVRKDVDDDDESEESDNESSSSSSSEEEEATKSKGKGTQKKKKAKGKAKDEDEDENEEESDDNMLEDSSDDDEDEFYEGDFDEIVVCTLDSAKTYQQPLNFSIANGEPVYFKARGDLTIHLTGNYFSVPRNSLQEYDSEESDDEDMDLEDYLSRINGGSYDSDEESDEESDKLDDIDNPRITEIEDDEDAPALIAAKKSDEAPKDLSKKQKKAAAKATQLQAQTIETTVSAISGKGNKKRSADEMDLDATSGEANGSTVTSTTATVITTDTAPSNLSKKQQKKLKAKNGEAVPAASTPPAEKKKVQFASQLEQGPTPNGNKSPTAPAEKSALKVRTVDGVKIEDHKQGSGPEAKKGSKVSMRYIGKLTDGKVFDSCKKGKPFVFTLGQGQVIKGWDIGVAGMKVGGERKLVIPPNLAYGGKALPGIPKNSTLVFELKVIDIK